ncbi:DUF4328 domain-containing protein [Luteolibacter sp. GHJ8]|uniref:DUF4328 domain-containing protein n=1 Tax=Luteolibacter rhizosphaerae TaxID=2989719 RepID=A0ABT3G8Z3_9BACT|nr:DUF4328 domain-containing protein [Luteolibacter rhizosphaerae]MCW1916097.1 DUF4328 domain-containing protein [Luteolibacter rhizosphaerae]
MAEEPVDPYVPPATNWMPPGSNLRSEHLRNPRLWAHLCCWPYGIAATFDLVHQLLGLAGYTAAPTWQKFMGQTLVGARISAALFFLCWVYRVAWNARKLAPPGTTVEPAGIVGTFFIPALNLVAPWWQMKRVARITAGTALQNHIKVWWAAVLVAYLIPFHLLTILGVLEDHIRDSLLGDGIVRYWYDYLSKPLFFLVAITGITMVMRLTRAQLRRDAR